MYNMIFRAKRKDTNDWIEGYYVKVKDYLTEKDIHVIVPLNTTLFPRNEFADYEEIDPDTLHTYHMETNRQYISIFDDASPAWSHNAERNYVFLIRQEEYANACVKNKGHLFLNEVYDMLGLPRTKIGQLVGWSYDATHPTEGRIVDFGLPKDGHEKSIVLTFNVQGELK